VVVADATTRNPNVNYELGICHTLGVPTVIITKNMEDVPFDYQHHRCITYDTIKPDWASKLRHDITETLRIVLAEPVEMDELRWPYDTNAVQSKLQATSLWSSADAIDVVISGARNVTSVLGGSFGPNGAFVSVTDAQGEQLQLKDAPSIAAVVRSGDPLEKVGIKQMQSLIRDMRSSVGDYAKTAGLICERLLAGGREAQKNGADIKTTVREILEIADLVVSALRRRSMPATDSETIRNIASTAACGDTVTAMIMSEAYRRAGKDGVIYTELSPCVDTQLETVEGMYFDRGYLNEGFATDESTGVCTLSDCYILLSERKIASMKELLPVLEKVARANRSLLVIADDIEGEALSTLLVNKLRGTFNCAAVKAPGYGERRRAILEDIAVLTGARTVTVALGLTLDSLSIGDLGQAKDVIVTKDDTNIRGGAGRPEAIQQRVTALRNAVERATDAMEREKLQERLARLVGAVVAIKVGGQTRADALNRQYRMEGAMYSTRIAMESGCVEGGGVALHEVRVALENEARGVLPGRTVVFDAIDAPLQQLLKTVDPQASFKLQDGEGVDIRTRQVVNMREAGIVDPVGSLCKAVEIASTYATTILQTKAWDLAEPSVPPHPLAQFKVTEGSQ
jgi:chaperonin GroEL